MASSAEYAVFTEFSPDTKQALPGWNRRVFTDTDVRKGAAIQCDFKTGIVTLAPGAYHVSGLSMVAYFTKDDPSETIVTRSPASAGYCRLRSFDPDAAVDPATLRGLPNSDPRIICIGSPSTANLVPSLFETFYETDRPAQIVLEHQSGSKPEQIYLRVFVENSKWHAFARISIKRTVSGCERRRILSCSSGLRAGSLMSDARGPEGTDTSSCRPCSIGENGGNG